MSVEYGGSRIKARLTTDHRHTLYLRVLTFTLSHSPSLDTTTKFNTPPLLPSRREREKEREILGGWERETRENVRLRGREWERGREREGGRARERESKSLDTVILVPSTFWYPRPNVILVPHSTRRFFFPIFIAISAPFLSPFLRHSSAYFTLTYRQIVGFTLTYRQIVGTKSAPPNFGKAAFSSSAVVGTTPSVLSSSLRNRICKIHAGQQSSTLHLNHTNKSNDQVTVNCSRRTKQSASPWLRS